MSSVRATATMWSNVNWDLNITRWDHTLSSGFAKPAHFSRREVPWVRIVGVAGVNTVSNRSRSFTFGSIELNVPNAALSIIVLSKHAVEFYSKYGVISSFVERDRPELSIGFGVGPVHPRVVLPVSNSITITATLQESGKEQRTNEPSW